MVAGSPVTDRHASEGLRRLARDSWEIPCRCGRKIAGADPIAAHRAHQDHVVAEFLAEQTGVERAA